MTAHPWQAYDPKSGAFAEFDDPVAARRFYQDALGGRWAVLRDRLARLLSPASTARACLSAPRFDASADPTVEIPPARSSCPGHPLSGGVVLGGES